MAKTDDGEASRDKIIGRNLTAIRGERTQQWIAEQMRPRGFNWSQATLWAIETGKRPLRLTEAEALADVLGFPLANLLQLPDMVKLQELVDTYVGAEGDLRRAAEAMEDALCAASVLADRMIEGGTPQDEVTFWLDGIGAGLTYMWTPAQYLLALKPVTHRDGHPIGRYTERYLTAPMDEEWEAPRGKRQAKG